MKKRFVLAAAIMSIGLSSCGRDLSMYPQWARDYIADGYSFSSDVPKKEIDEYLKADSILPEIDFDEIVHGYVPPTNGKAPFYVMIFDGLHRSELTDAFVDVGYQFRTAFKYYDYLLYDNGKWSLKVCDLCRVESNSENGTVFIPYQTQINFYKEADVPNAVTNANQ